MGKSDKNREEAKRELKKGNGSMERSPSDSKNERQDDKRPEEESRSEAKPNSSKRTISLDETIREGKEGIASYFASNVTYASEKAIQYIYNLQDDVVGFSETNLDREQTLKPLKRMRKGEKWNAAAACGTRKAGRKGLSAGVTIATRRDLKAMLTDVDHECITGPPVASEPS